MFELLQPPLTHAAAFLNTTGVFIFVIAMLVFWHELGHYLAARSVGVHCDAFSIGFGKKLFSWKDKAGCVWKVCLIPLGGYVQMKGQEDGKPIDHASVDDDSFAAKKIWQRAWIIIAGPLANFMLAAAIFAAVFATYGKQYIQPVVGVMQPDMPAQAVLQTGDIITKINGADIVKWKDLQNAVEGQAGKELEMMITRENTPLMVRLTPKSQTFNDYFGQEHTVGRVGISPQGASGFTHYSFSEALMGGFTETWRVTTATLNALKHLVMGSAPLKDIAGPLGIAQMSGDAAKTGLYALLGLLAIISVNLGIMNLLPIPVLDGGHLVMLAYEKVRGKPLGERGQVWAMRVGMAFIACLIVVATSNDIRRLIEKFFG